MASPRKATAPKSAVEDDFMNSLDARKQWAARREAAMDKASSLLDTIAISYRMLPPYQRVLVCFVAGAGLCVIYGSGTLKA